MGLLQTYNSSNRVIINDKVVTYSKQRIYGSWSYQPSPSQTTTYDQAWEYHRYCAKSYMYVGMSLSAANTCASAMINNYTRNVYVSEWNSSGQYAGTFTDEGGGSICMADICVQQREGPMYDVIVNVREDDTKLRIGSVNPATLFTVENARDYDNA